MRGHALRAWAKSADAAQDQPLGNPHQPELLDSLHGLMDWG